MLNDLVQRPNRHSGAHALALELGKPESELMPELFRMLGAHNLLGVLYWTEGHEAKFHRMSDLRRKIARGG